MCFLNESVEGFGHLRGRAVEGDKDSVVSHVDLGVPHATDCRQGLREQEQEEAADAGAVMDRGVVEEQFDVAPADRHLTSSPKENQTGRA